ncbi:MAG: hypothetical protein RLZZ480_11 [Candidatus Parcubacteria bacterium]|jgi:ribA/ribD-fused uncharacterized protein
MSDIFLGEDFSEDAAESINFLETRINDLSPFAALEVAIDGTVYKTAEHAYQALRVPLEQRQSIIDANSPLEAWREGQKCKATGQQLAKDKDGLMENIFRAKLEQHPYLKEVLIRTGQKELVKIMPTDLYWGTTSTGEGQNKMGKLWMKLRSELQ